MVNVLLCGNPLDLSISEALVPALSLYGGLCFSGREQVLESGASARYFLYESEKVPDIEMEKGILLFKNGIRQKAPVHVPEGFLCVLGSRNTKAAELLNGTDAAVVTCGTGPKDTLSLAGLENSCATVSLQRNLITLSGNLLEPHDFNVSLSRQRSPYQVLFVSAVLLISDIDSGNGYIV
jgi:hypothetical protein